MTAGIRSFEYLAPRTLDDALDMKARYGTRATLWAGGTDLLLQWQSGRVDIECCIDLSNVGELSGIEAHGATTRIGSLTTIAAIHSSDHLAANLPALVEMAGQFATPQIRNLATVGGNLCHAVPSADTAIPLMAYDAAVHLQSAYDTRTLSLESF
ncbi:FAD binding domain-containing protein, partial [bacterium]|nr:FAD binding domain-containing protein [bacterium]